MDFYLLPSLQGQLFYWASEMYTIFLSPRFINKNNNFFGLLLRKQNWLFIQSNYIWVIFYNNTAQKVKKWSLEHFDQWAIALWKIPGLIMLIFLINYGWFAILCWCQLDSYSKVIHLITYIYTYIDAYKYLLFDSIPLYFNIRYWIQFSVLYHKSLSFVTYGELHFC